MFKVSVITIVLNAEESILGCLQSVNSQFSEDRMQHVIVDGGSTDDTLPILKKWSGHPITMISEKDRGISDAFNKGIDLSAGEIVTLLNSDDRWCPGAVNRSIMTLDRHPEAAFCFGHCAHTDARGGKWTNYGNPKYYDRMRYFMPDVNHPTMFIRRSTYHRVGRYDLKWRFAMDYDWLQRAEALGMRGILIDEIQTEMAMGGLSDRYWLATYAEARDISIRYGVPTHRAYIDYGYRILKGSARRTLSRFGCHRLEQRIRRLRQRLILNR